MNIDLEAILTLWDELPRSEFEQALCKAGWRLHKPVTWKRVYVRGGLVLKFDDEDDRSKNCHTAYEYRQWGRAAPHKRRYLVKPIAFRHGLLIQPRLPVTCHWRDCNCPDNVAKIAHRLRILDWKNHGYTATGKLKFFDSDSLGSGWWNWKRRRVDEALESLNE